MATRNDVRVVKTRQKLQMALIGMLKERRIEDLSITAVCRAAGVNRNTFYAHYSDVKDLLDEVKSSYLEYMLSEMSGERKKGAGVEDMLIYFMKIIGVSRDIFPVLYRDEGGQVFLSSLVRLTMEETLSSSFSYMDRDEKADTVSFIIGGVSSMIDIWLKSSSADAGTEAGKIYRIIEKVGK